MKEDYLRTCSGAGSSGNCVRISPPHHMILFSASSFTNRFVTPFFHHLFGVGSTWTMSSEQEARSMTRRTLKSITCGHTRQGHLPHLLLGGFTTLGRLPKGTRGYPPTPGHRSCCRLGSSRLWRYFAVGGNVLGFRWY